METYPHVFQAADVAVNPAPFELKGKWHSQFFKNDNPIVLELGCGRGEYTVGLARLFPDKNFIGVDIKGARMWTGATDSLNEGLKNVAFLRTHIEFIDHFFAEGEVAEIWLNFSDPQMKKVTKRLTSTHFMARYRHFLTDGGLVHLKTDSNFLFTYTNYMVEKNTLPVEFRTDSHYHPLGLRSGSPSKTSKSVCRKLANSLNPKWKLNSTTTEATTAQNVADCKRLNKRSGLQTAQSQKHVVQFNNVSGVSDRPTCLTFCGCKMSKNTE